MCPLFILSMKVSIIIPVYNQEHLILRALDSIPRREDIEIIVCDDASTDRTVPNIIAWSQNHPDVRLKLIRNEVNRGEGYSRNECINKCTGEYIYGIDSDDYLYTNEWEKALEQLDGTDLVYVSAYSDGNKPWIPRWDIRLSWGAFWLKFVRREFFGNIRCECVRWATDKGFTEKLYERNPSVKFTGIFAYHYSWPRVGSLCWEHEHGSDA